MAAPLIDVLPEGASMIATDVAAPFLTPFKLAFMLSIVAAFPYLLHQMWGFIAPGLYSHEKTRCAYLIFLCFSFLQWYCICLFYCLSARLCFLYQRSPRRYYDSDRYKQLLGFYS
ncbi:twin-arginine translocase subunit TatC [Psychrosphaera algicola]|uniref:twin-arginine translocase subunit TatC n=1 Tax=Psychrosphaera algicola TaxID=3023714 RepID=UPI00351CB929